MTGIETQRLLPPEYNQPMDKKVVFQRNDPAHAALRNIEDSFEFLKIALELGEQGEFQRMFGILQEVLPVFVVTTIMLGRRLPVSIHGEPVLLEVPDPILDRAFKIPDGRRGYHKIKSNMLSVHFHLDRLNDVMMNSLWYDPDWQGMRNNFGNLIETISNGHETLHQALISDDQDLRALHLTSKEYIAAKQHRSLELYQHIMHNGTDNMLECLLQTAGNDIEMKEELMVGLVTLFIKGMEVDMAFWTMVHRFDPTLIPDDIWDRRFNMWINGFQDIKEKLLKKHHSMWRNYHFHYLKNIGIIPAFFLINIWPLSYYFFGTFL